MSTAEPQPRSYWLRRTRQFSSVLVACLAAAACAAPTASVVGQPGSTVPSGRSWSQVLKAARGSTVSLWMWGGDPKGNAYVDDVLAPAARRLGITLRRVPVADTKDAVNRVLSERQAGVTDGAVDLVWVNGDNFATGMQVGAWRCGWTKELPNMTYTNPKDPLLVSDFGTPVNGCEAPWHKAQFVLAYNAATVTNPPTTLEGVLQWARQHPGRFTYPAPPDFTGSVFTREVLYATSGGYRQIPARYDQAAYDRLTPALWRTLKDLAPSLWRGGQTYPRDSVALDKLYADGQVDMTMTYGPATLTDLVAKGSFPKSTRVLSLQDGTVGNASFLAIPSTSAHPDAAMAVANLALSPEQQVAKADPSTWGQFTVLDTTRLPPGARRQFAALPSSPVVPSYQVISKNAQPELAASWVTALDEGWRRAVLAGR